MYSRFKKKLRFLPLFLPSILWLSTHENGIILGAYVANPEISIDCRVLATIMKL